MPESQQHAILRHYLDVEMAGTEQEALTLSRSLSDVCSRLLFPAIERVLNRCSPNDEFLVIERLDIDAGCISLNGVAEELPDLVSVALEQALKATTTVHGQSRHSGSDKPKRRITEPERLLEAFLFFLEHGTLPWFFSNGSLSMFESAFTGVWKSSATEIARSGFHGELLREKLRSRSARTRLTCQFSPAFVDGILAYYSQKTADIATRLIEATTRSENHFVRMDRIGRFVREAALACIASGSNATMKLLLAELQSVPERADTLSVEREWLRSWITMNSSVMEKGVSDSTAKNEKKHSRKADVREIPHQKNVLPDDVRPVEDSLKEQTSGRSGSALSQLHSEKNAHPGPGSEGGSPDIETKPVMKRSPEPGKERHAPAADMISSESEGDMAGSANIDTEGRGAHCDETCSDEKKTALIKPLSGDSTGSAGMADSVSCQEHPDSATGLYIDHAGLVLLHPFLPLFFRGLGIAGDDTLLHENRALFLLHYLVTGNWCAAEYELVLMKVLCGLPLAFVSEPEDPLKPEEAEEAEALLAAVIRHWEALKNTGPAGLRETFLKRSGKLVSKNDGEWLLQVESKGYDILLDRLPWEISMIRLPWMPSMLRVEWLS